MLLDCFQHSSNIKIPQGRLRGIYRGMLMFKYANNVESSSSTLAVSYE